MEGFIRRSSDLADTIMHANSTNKQHWLARNIHISALREWQKQTYTINRLNICIDVLTLVVNNVFSLFCIDM